MSKRIALYGGWSRNFGDLCINSAMKKLFKDNSPVELEFLDINSDLAYDPQGYRNYPPPTLSSELVEEINDTCNLLVVGGGGQIMSRGKNESVSGWQFNVSEADLDKLRVPLVCYGLGYNQFPREKPFFYSFKSHLSKTYKKSVLFSVRNVGTANVVRQAINEEDPIYLISDPAMFVEGKKLNIPGIGTEPVLGLNWAGDAPDKRFYGNEEADLFMETVNFCRKWIKDTKGKVLYIPHIMYYDFEKFDSFRDHLGEDIIGLHIACPWLYPEALIATPLFVGAYQACTAVLGMRGHANIVPFGQGVPAYGYGAHDKVKFFHKEVGGSFLGNELTKHYTPFMNEVFTNRAETLKLMEIAKKEMFETTRVFTQMSLGYL